MIDCPIYFPILPRPPPLVKTKSEPARDFFSRAGLIFKIDLPLYIQSPRGETRQTRGTWIVVTRVVIPVRVRAGALAPDFMFDSFNLGYNPRKVVIAMTKTKCRPERIGKPGPKTVGVKTHRRSKPKPIRKKCGQRNKPGATFLLRLNINFFES